MRTDMMCEQMAEGRRRETEALAETAGLYGRWSYTDHDGNQTWSDDWGATLTQQATFEDTFQAIFDEAFDLLVARQRKYGPTNIDQQGIYGVFKRISDDKMARIGRVLNGRIVNGEIMLDPLPDGDDDDTFEDALLDVANYALIMLALKRGLWGRPLAGEIID